MNFYISNKISNSYKELLEQLFYFNSRQKNHLNAIESMIEKYGDPKIIEKDDYVKMITNKCPASHSFFISKGPRLIGVVIYHQNTPSNIEIIHIALDNEYFENENTKLLDLLKYCLINLKIAKLKTFSIGYLSNSYKFKLKD